MRTIMDMRGRSDALRTLGIPSRIEAVRWQWTLRRATPASAVDDVYHLSGPRIDEGQPDRRHDVVVFADFGDAVCNRARQGLQND